MEANIKRYQPTVVHPIELANFIQYILEYHGTPTNLIVCSSQEIFVTQLQASIAYEKDLECQEAESTGLDPVKVSRIASRKHELLIPTIHQLATSQTINVTFCATLAQLQAYIGVYGMTAPKSPPESHVIATSPPILALLNPLQLHRDTSSFSAQGLSRTFASAVEAASLADKQLIVVECPSRLTREASSSPVPAGLEDVDEEMEHASVGGGGLAEETDSDPWEQRVAILNVTTKSFGAGERGWVGRTVQVKRVVGRWCVFESLDMLRRED